MKFFLILLATFFVAPAFALAAVPARLLVQFESAPLFQNANFIPFDEVSRFVKVTNNTDVSQEVIVEAIHYSSCPLIGACFAKKLHLKITSGTDMYFDKPLSDFYGAGTVSLGNLGAGAMKQYDFRIVFEGGLDDNDYQNSTTNFDLLAGFAGTEGSISSGGATSGGDIGGGGGGGLALPGLQINNEAVVSVSESTAAVSWNTNYFAWGDVIYGIDTGTPYTLNLSLPNFGYPSSAPSDPQAVLHNHANSKSLNHLIHLNGLTPGATYRYRAASHASPPTVGYEHTFTVPNTSRLDGENDGIGGSAELPDENGMVLGVMKESGDGAKITGNRQQETNNSEDQFAENKVQNKNIDKNLAAAFGAFGDTENWRRILILLIIFILFLFWRRKKSNKGE